MNPPNNPSSTISRRRGKKENTHKNGNGKVYSNGTITSSEPSNAPSPPPPSTLSTTTSILAVWAPTLVLIFGGCCSNVYTLESLIHASPSSGSLITGFQFLLVALVTLPRHLSLTRGWRNFYLRERSIPLRKWIVYTAYFLSINILNNTAFKYRISVPLHIILRSAGPVTTMAAGRIWAGKRYPPHKIIAVLLLFSGVVLAAFTDAWSKEAEQAEVEYHFTDSKTSTAAVSALSSQAQGFALLASALILSACMGLFADDMYATHGRSGSITAETLFYSHAMSLPYFASQAKPLVTEFMNVTGASGFSTTRSTPTPFHLDPNATDAAWTKYLPSPISPNLLSRPLFTPLSITIPRPLLLLLLNALTQLLCIIGVNTLSAQSSSLTVSIVLNIRKLASLVLSIWLFGNNLPVGVMIGAAVVFIGGGLYALPAGSPKRQERSQEGAKVKSG